MYRFDEVLVTHTQVDYRFIVKGKQPELDAQLRALPWREIPCWTAPATWSGRVDIRTLKARSP